MKYKLGRLSLVWRRCEKKNVRYSNHNFGKAFYCYGTGTGSRNLFFHKKTKLLEQAMRFSNYS
jgi:hypothetical protein